MLLLLYVCINCSGALKNDNKHKNLKMSLFCRQTKKYGSLCWENVVYALWAKKMKKNCVASRPCSLSSPASDYPQVIKRLPVFLLFSNFNLWQAAVAVNFCNSEGLKAWGRDLVILTKEVARSELAIKVTILVKVKSYNKIRETIQCISFYCIVCFISLLCE